MTKIISVATPIFYTSSGVKTVVTRRLHGDSVETFFNKHFP